MPPVHPTNVRVHAINPERMQWALRNPRGTRKGQSDLQAVRSKTRKGHFVHKGLDTKRKGQSALQAVRSKKEGTLV